MGIGIGSRVGPYEVIAPLGAGGMGEVYRARDARLHRDVALKVLPDHFAADPERLARFEREAQALAALKHPHIATIHGVEEKDGSRALVLELVEGETLADLLARGPLPVDEAVRLARQIADALDAAHEHGVIHRDLKPANLKITPDGAVKVLDFGLAKFDVAGEVVSGGPASLSMSPTMTSPALITGAMVLLGTAGYMAPEQARGKPIDKRADIWAFGVVLYEMLAGTRAFAGESVTEVAGAVIHKDPDWTALPAATPPTVRMIVRRCLQKDPRQRFRDMGDVRLALDGAFAVEPELQPPPDRRERRRSGWIPLAAAAALGALIAGAGVWTLARRAPASPPILRFAVPAPAPKTSTPVIEISPDGRQIAFVAVDASGSPRVWIHALDTGESRIVTPRDETREPIFWSPDSRYVAFFSEGRIKKVPAAGGPAEAIATATLYMGGTWNQDGVVLFAGPAGIMRVPASGGEAVNVTAIGQGRGAHLLPRFLPDGRRFLYLRGGVPDTSGLYVGSLDAVPQDQSDTRVLPLQQQAVYAPSASGGAGYLLYLRDGLLTAQRFDADRLTLAGDAVTVLPDEIETTNVFATLSASATGTLIYRRGGAAASRRLKAFDRTGKAETLLGGVALSAPRYPRLSLDGRRLAVVLEGQLWAYDLSGSAPLMLTYDGTHYSSVWTRDGRRLVMERDADANGQTLFSVAADGSSAALQPVGPAGHYHPHGWTADGELVATHVIDGGLDMDLVRFAPAPGGQPETILSTPAREGNSASVSPDGRWLAYTAESTGRSEVWVRPLSGTGAAVRVSSDGGGEPVWSKDGRELYYLDDGKIMAVAADAGAEFNFRVPVALFTSDATVGGPDGYSMLPDGRFLAFSADEAPDPPISVITNWTELLTRRAAAH